MVYESNEKLTPDQISAMDSKDVNDYLNSHCMPDPSVNNPAQKAFRKWDQNILERTDPKNVGKIWIDLMARQRATLPWLIITSPNGTFEGPLPKTKDEMLATLKKYGG